MNFKNNIQMIIRQLKKKALLKKLRKQLDSKKIISHLLKCKR